MKKTYFISDAHLGAKTIENPLDHERRIVRFLDSIKEDAGAVYMLGDIIDFWFEYKTVVPRGFNRFLGKIGELTDRGIEVHWFAGNHDIWLFDYFPTELGVIIHKRGGEVEIGGKKFYLAHGDGLGDDSKAYKLMKGMFHSKLCQRLFAMIHPRWGVAFAQNWSKHSRLTGGEYDHFLGEKNEHLVLFAKDYLKKVDVNYFIFGHRHILLDMMLSRDSRIMILGDWIRHFSYGVFDGENLTLEIFEEENACSANAPQVSIAF